MNASTSDDQTQPLKRQRADDGQAITLYAPPEENVDQNVDAGGFRTSSLADPTMKLSGHKGSVYCIAYDPQGDLLCSGSFDTTCLLWKGELDWLVGSHPLYPNTDPEPSRTCDVQPAETARTLPSCQVTRMPFSTADSQMTAIKL